MPSEHNLLQVDNTHFLVKLGIHNCKSGRCFKLHICVVLPFKYALNIKLSMQNQNKIQKLFFPIATRQ